MPRYSEASADVHALLAAVASARASRVWRRWGGRTEAEASAAADGIHEEPIHEVMVDQVEQAAKVKTKKTHSRRDEEEASEEEWRPDELGQPLACLQSS